MDVTCSMNIMLNSQECVRCIKKYASNMWHRCAFVYMILLFMHVQLESAWVILPLGERQRHLTRSYKHQHTSVSQEGVSIRVCLSAKTLPSPLWPHYCLCVCVCVLSCQMWAARPHCLHMTPCCELWVWWCLWLAASYELIKLLTQRWSAR